MEIVHWYRYIDPETQGDEPYLLEFQVVKEAPKTVVIMVWGEAKRVLKEARKRFAYPTKELALESYMIRKERQAQYAAAVVDQAKDNLAAAKALLDPDYRDKPTTRIPWGKIQLT